STEDSIARHRRVPTASIRDPRTPVNPLAVSPNKCALTGRCYRKVKGSSARDTPLLAESPERRGIVEGSPGGIPTHLAYSPRQMRLRPWAPIQYLQSQRPARWAATGHAHSAGSCTG